MKTRGTREKRHIAWVIVVKLPTEHGMDKLPRRRTFPVSEDWLDRNMNTFEVQHGDNTIDSSGQSSKIPFKLVS